MKQFRARNLKANYEPAGKHKDFIFFATDTHEILVNGVAYGMDITQLAELEKAFDTVEFNPATMALTFTAIDGTVKTINLPKVTAADTSVVVTPPTAAGEHYQIKANVKAGDDNALKLDADGLYVDQSALDKYIGSNAIQVSAVNASGEKTISLKVADADKVLTQNAQGLLVNLNLAYDSTTKKINLTGKDSAVLASVDATAFIKDGMLNSVELVANPEGQEAGTYIKFVFNTDAGTEPLFLNVTGLIDVYTAGDGLALEGKTFKAKIDSTSEAYISVGANGIKISGIDQAIQDAIDGLKSTIDNYTINGKKISTNPTLTGADIQATGYAKGSSSAALAASDTLNAALAKLENQIEAAVAWYEA